MFHARVAPYGKKNILEHIIFFVRNHLLRGTPSYASPPLAIGAIPKCAHHGIVPHPPIRTPADSWAVWCTLRTCIFGSKSLSVPPGFDFRDKLGICIVHEDHELVWFLSFCFGAAGKILGVNS